MRKLIIIIIILLITITSANAKFFKIQKNVSSSKSFKVKTKGDLKDAQDKSKEYNKKYDDYKDKLKKLEKNKWVKKIF